MTESSGTPSATPQPEARVIRTVVCAFSRDELPADDLQVFRRFEHSMKKAGLDVRVRLEPIEQLPEQFDVLVVSPALERRANQVGGDAIVMVTTRQTAASAADRLLAEIARGYPITAARKDPNAPHIVRRRGYEVL
ncbi:MAG: hypothetical protein E6I57_06165 [Chloroflexi bacterium]|nr:MAG: hypothetical protein E6J38_10335 [Chloroflexota bacterium]TMC33940.1 MAG: hypothetical protein E6J24_08175 [Chloroflexota bacterium]TMC57753.1 MAG: hypothetical protein E6J19_05130 [Chloroflexota bacterium]TME39892.1 MAG: hypothetical protein E6I57_06165 [Chloroflexota bacterium]